MKTPTLEERIENAKALIEQHQRDIYALERHLLNLEHMRADQIVAVKIEVA